MQAPSKHFDLAQLVGNPAAAILYLVELPAGQLARVIGRALDAGAMIQAAAHTIALAALRVIALRIAAAGAGSLGMY